MNRLIIILLLSMAVGCSPQAPPAAVKGVDLPRTRDGKPDLNGIWQVINTANWNLEPHAAGQGATEVLGAIGAMPPGTGVVEGETIPYLPAALAQRNMNFATRRTEDPEAKCFRPGVPRATYMPYPFQLFQTDSELFIAYEYASATRSVYMNEHKAAPFDTWMGWSNGHWEGDTLVVEVTAQNSQGWLDRAGNYASPGVRVTERYTLTDADHLLYEATIEDPDVFSRPWKLSMPVYRLKEADIQLLEFKCIEFAEELMYGHLRKAATKGGSGNE